MPADLLEPRSRRPRVDYGTLKKALHKDTGQRGARDISAVDAFLQGLPRVLVPVDSARMRTLLSSVLQAEEFGKDEVILNANRDSDVGRQTMNHQIAHRYVLTKHHSSSPGEPQRGGRPGLGTAQPASLGAVLTPEGVRGSPSAWPLRTRP